MLFKATRGNCLKAARFFLMWQVAMLVFSNSFLVPGSFVHWMSCIGTETKPDSNRSCLMSEWLRQIRRSKELIPFKLGEVWEDEKSCGNTGFCIFFAFSKLFLLSQSLECACYGINCRADNRYGFPSSCDLVRNVLQRGLKWNLQNLFPKGDGLFWG